MVLAGVRSREVGVRHVDMHLAPVFFGHETAFRAVADDLGRDQDDEFGLLDLVVPVGERGAKPGYVAEQRDLVAGLAGLLLDHAAERQNLAVVDDDGGLDAALLDGRRVDSGRWWSSPRR